MRRRSFNLRAKKLATRVKMGCATDFACSGRGLRRQMQGDRVLQPGRGLGTWLRKDQPMCLEARVGPRPPKPSGGHGGSLTAHLVAAAIHTCTRLLAATLVRCHSVALLSHSKFPLRCPFFEADIHSWTMIKLSNRTTAFSRILGDFVHLVHCRIKEP